MSNAARVSALTDVLGRTLAAVGVALRRRDAGLVLAGSALGYLLAYSVAVGDLALSGGGGVSVLVVERPLDRAFRSMGYLSFEPIARVDAFGLVYLFSPLDALLALVLSALVGVNLALTYLGLVQPRACGLEASSGVFAAVPALLSGAACCGPAIFAVVGIQLTGLLVAGFELLVPVALSLLVASLLLVGRRVDPSLL